MRKKTSIRASLRFSFSEEIYVPQGAHTLFFPFFCDHVKKNALFWSTIKSDFFFFVAGPSIVHFGPHESGDVSSLSRGRGVWIHSFCERKSARERRKKSNEYLPQRHEFALKELHNARTLLRYIYIEREHIHKHERAHT